MASFMRMSPDYNSQPADEREGKQPAPGGGHPYMVYTRICLWTGYGFCAFYPKRCI